MRSVTPSYVLRLAVSMPLVAVPLVTIPLATMALVAIPLAAMPVVPLPLVTMSGEVSHTQLVTTPLSYHLGG